MILQKLGWGADAVERAKFVKNLSYGGVGGVDSLGSMEKFILGNLGSVSSNFIKLNKQKRHNLGYTNTCFDTASYFFNRFLKTSPYYRDGALLTLEGELVGVAKKFDETNFLALRSFYQKSSFLKSFYSFPLIKGVAYSVDLDVQKVFRDAIDKRAGGSWGHIEIADLTKPINVVPTRVLLGHELDHDKNLYEFESLIVREFPFLPDNSLIHDYMRK